MAGCLRRDRDRDLFLGLLLYLGVEDGRRRLLRNRLCLAFHRALIFSNTEAAAPTLSKPIRAVIKYIVIIEIDSYQWLGFGLEVPLNYARG